MGNTASTAPKSGPVLDAQRTIDDDVALFPRLDRTVAIRRIQLLRRFGGTLPVEVFVRWFGVSAGAINLMRLTLGIPLTAHEGRRIRREFLARESVPRYAGLVEPDQEAVQRVHRELREELHVALADGISRCDSWEQFRAAVIASAKLIPSQVLAAVFGRSQSTIRTILREGKVEVGAAQALTLLKTFTDAPVRRYEFLNEAGNREVAAQWRALRQRRLERFDKATEAGVVAYKKRLRRASNEDRTSERIRCTGSCERSYPATTACFARSPLGAERVITRCKLCNYVTRRKSERALLEHPRAKRQIGRVLRGTELARFRTVILAHGREIPPELLASMFNVGDGSVIRTRRELDRLLPNGGTARLIYQWTVMEAMPELATLNDDERTRLRELWMQWREANRDRLQIDAQHVQILKEDRGRARIGTGPVNEVECDQCGEPYPRNKNFFNSRSLRNTKPTCKPCHNLNLRLANQKAVLSGSYRVDAS